MRIDARQVFTGLLVAGVAGGFLFLPAIIYIGSFLAPSPITPSANHVSPLIADALWARAGGGRDSQLREINPFTLARIASCRVLAETMNDEPAKEHEHEKCMELMPGVQAVGYVSSLHLRSTGVWQDPRVPFVQLATMARMSDKWTRTQLVDTLAERGEFRFGIRGIEDGARRYFGRAAGELTVAQAALLAGMIGDRRLDPWCDPDAAIALRRRILTRMRDNLAIDAPTFDAADRAELGLAGAPPEGHKPCGD